MSSLKERSKLLKQITIDNKFEPFVIRLGKEKGAKLIHCQFESVKYEPFGKVIVKINGIEI